MHSPIDSTSQPTPAEPQRIPAVGPGPNDELAAVAVLAGLLERMERSDRAVEPAAYRSVVTRLTGMLERSSGHPMLEKLLAGAPATAELYENMRYAHAGLCLRPLETSLRTERQARDVIAKARRTTA